MIKHVVFDFDGTIADTIDLVPEIVNEVLAHFSKPTLTDSEIAYFMSKGIRKASKEFGVKWRELPKYGLAAQKAMQTKLDSINLFENIKEVLEELAQKYTTNIISLNSKDNIKHIIEKHQINTIENVFSTKGKPSKNKILKKYLKQFNINRNEMLYVGDELGDIEACKKNNIKVIAVTWGLDSKELLSSAQPDHLISCPREIVDIAAAY